MTHLPSSVLSRAGDRIDDVRVGAAAAEIAAHPVPDLIGRGARVGAQQALGRDDLAGRAVAALEGVVLDEGLLDRRRDPRRRADPRRW